MECSTQHTSTLLTLKNDLFCNYDQTVMPPGTGPNSSAVYVRLVLQFLQFWETSDTLRLHAWMDLDWIDERLTWNPEEYLTLSRITIDRHPLWFPDIELHGATETGHSLPVPQNASCELSSAGQVSCSTPVVLSQRCHVDASNWPYDQHRCSLSIGSYIHLASEYDIRLHQEPVQLYRFRQSQDWRLVEVKARRFTSRARGGVYPWLKYDVSLERHAAGHLAVVVVPALVLVVLTLSSFWVEPECAERIAMCCSNVACHVVFVLYMIYLVPSNADNLPLILRFYVDSFVLASVTTVTSVITYALAQRSSVPPTYVSRYTNNITNNFLGKFLISEEFNSKENGSRENEQEINEVLPGSKQQSPSEWLIIATLVDRAVFATYVLVMVILMYRFIV